MLICTGLEIFCTSQKITKWQQENVRVKREVEINGIYIFGHFIQSQLAQPDLKSRFMLGFSQVPVFSQTPLLARVYRWSHNPPTYRRAVTPNWYRTQTIPKFGLESSWITCACHCTRIMPVSTRTVSDVNLNKAFTIRTFVAFSLYIKCFVLASEEK